MDDVVSQIKDQIFNIKYVELAFGESSFNKDS